MPIDPKNILSMRLGSDHAKALTQKEVANILGITIQEVKTAESTALLLINKASQTEKTRKAASFPRTDKAVDRIFALHAALQKQYKNPTHPGCKVTATKFAEIFQVNEKTVRDYLSLRMQIPPYNLPLEWNSALGTWRYRHEVKSIMGGEFNPDELTALLVAREMLSIFKGTPFAGELKEVYDRLTLKFLSETHFLDKLSTKDLFSVQTSGAGIVEPTVFKTITAGLIQRTKLQITYQGKDRAEPTERIIQPYHLALINNQWQLIAFCELRKDWRNFTLSRFQKNPILLLDRFVRSPSFNALDYVGSSMGSKTGKQRITAKLRIAKAGAHYVRERNWHGSQIIKDLSDGSIEVTYRLSDLDDHVRWVLSFGSDCIVLEPRELAERIKQEAEKMVRN
jgi:predicted DNA-binding transcriptional regulator YafY